MKVFIGIVVTAVVIGIGIFLWNASTYTELGQKRQAVESSWGQVQNVYQRRADLIPNLVAVVKGYATHEKDTFVQVTEARQQVTQIQVNPSNLSTNLEAQKQFLGAQQSLGSALSRLLVVKEAYPELKANQNFLELQAQLEGTENRISVERHKNQLAVQDYNNLIVGYFSGWVAKRNGFEKMPYFQAEASAQTAPKVSF